MAFLSDSVSHLLNLGRRILACDTSPARNIIGQVNAPLGTLDENLLAVNWLGEPGERLVGGFIVGADKEMCDTALPVVSIGNRGSDSVSPPAPRAFANAALPLEILDMIFLIAVDFQSRAIRRSCRLESDTARHVSQVSRQWRCAALCSVKMWKQALDPDSNSFMWLVTVLKRCDYQPLALVSAPRRSLSLADVAKWTLLRRVYPSCRYIHLELKQGVDVRCVRWLLSTPSSNLIDATVVWDSKGLESGRPPSLTIGSQPLFRNNAPNLRRLHLINCPFPPVLLPSLRDVGIETLPGHKKTIFKLAPIQFLSLLRNLNGLTQLNLSHGLWDNLLLGIDPNIATAPRVCLPQLQTFTYRGDGAVFLALNERLDLPALCSARIFHDFSLFHAWSREKTDELIALSLALIPISDYKFMGISVQHKRLYISFGCPARYELCFDIREYHGEALPEPNHIHDILRTHPGLDRHPDLDYFVCAVRSWVFRYPELLNELTTLRFGSTVHGVSTLAMLPLLWMTPRLACFHIVTSDSLHNPHLIDALRQSRSGISSMRCLHTLTVPFGSLFDMRCASDDHDFSVFRRALQNHEPTSLLAAVRHIEFAVPPVLLKHCGSTAFDIVRQRVDGLESLLSFWTVSGVVVDHEWYRHFFYDITW